MKNLSERELEVLKLAVCGLNNREISDHMSITVCTVKAYMTSILRKFEVNNRTEIAFVTLANRIVPLEELKKQYDDVKHYTQRK